MDGLAIAAALGELLVAVEGTGIRTVYQPARDLFVLRVSGRGSPRILIAPGEATVHLTSLDIPNPEAPSSFAMLLRKHLRGGRIESVRQVGWDRIVHFEVERRRAGRSERIELVAELAGLRGNLLLVRDGLVIGAARKDPRNRPGQAYTPLPPQEKADPSSIERAAIESLLDAEDPIRALTRSLDGVGGPTARDLLAGVDVEDAEAPDRVRERLLGMMQWVEDPEAHLDSSHLRATFYPLPKPAEPVESFSAALDRVRELGVGLPGEREEERDVLVRLRHALGRRSRTAAKLREWLDGASEADALRRCADLLLMRQSDLSSGRDQVALSDPATGETVSIRLDPRLGPVDNAQRMHERAKRLRRGRSRVEARLRRIESEIGELERAIDTVDNGEPLPAEAIRLLEGRRRGKEPREDPATPPSRSLQLDGFTILVGKNARDNDRLLREASPDDLWLHVRGAAGSHVIVRRQGRAEIPEHVIEAAARLASRYSKLREERRVEVSVAAARDVRKPKGAPPGLAIVRNEDTLTVDP